ncbi:MAG: NAD(P)H-hydrate dehydratase [Oscillospiraceae bacterium]|nr:NAD(P)H-hydrate dehydratase [Candidatus Ruminococcus equi]
MKEITSDFVRKNLPKRPQNANKGTMGTLLSITGSYSMAGASILSAKSALKTGVGLLRQVVPQSIYPIVAGAVYEPVFVTVEDSIDKTVSKNAVDYLLSLSKTSTAVLLGCGLKNTEDIQILVERFICESEVPLIIDADGINALSQHIDILDKAKCEVVLTPHPKEFSRISGLSVEDIEKDREKAVAVFTDRYKNITLVLKGNGTLVKRYGCETYINKTGNEGMAKGGSGDVLSGIISSLTAQGVETHISSLCGVYIHGLAGDIAKEKFTEISMLPSDTVNCISEAFKKIKEN